MLFSNLHTPARHTGLLSHPVWTRALEGLAKLTPDDPDANLDWMPDKQMFVMVQGYTTEARASCRFEAHRRYIDIQYMLAGEEIIEIAPADALTPDTPFDPERDLVFFKTPEAPCTRLILRPGDFAVFFPEDAHMPKVQLQTPASLRKAVVKVDVSLFADPLCLE
jgi:YhcH/YjgK/YiaL family protein